MYTSIVSEVYEMPSSKPLIALRLDPEVHARVRAAADADHRTMQNYIELVLDRAVPKATSMSSRFVSGAFPQDLGSQIAAAVKRGPTSRPRARPRGKRG